MPLEPFAELPLLAAHLRETLRQKKTVLLYAYNGTGKTRLSMAFKEIGKQRQAAGDAAPATTPVAETAGDAGAGPAGAVDAVADAARDTLYFNAFTEDLFHWNNDLQADSDRRLLLNLQSRFFEGLFELEMDNRIRRLLDRYADFDFRIDVEEGAVRFWPKGAKADDPNIKVSRGEESIFIWCFFLVIVQLAMDPEIEAYRWVKFLYIDDPISSLDEHNAISVANHLAQLLKHPGNQLKTVISTHHTLFFNVLCNELGNARKYFVNRPISGAAYTLQEEKGDTPFFHHVAALAEMYQAAQEDRLFTHHFNMLRTILEKTASFHGQNNFAVCIKQQDDDPDGILHTRLINILSHGNYSLFEPQQMLEENKRYFRKILDDFLKRYPFNPALFPAAPPAVENAVEPADVVAGNP